MANKTSTLTVRLIDAVAGPARSAANAIRGIGAAVDQTNARRLNLAGAINTMTRDVSTATNRLRKNINGMTTGLSMPAGFMTFFGARSVYNFEKMSNKLEAVTNMTGQQKKEIQGYAKELNELFPFTNEQIMGAAFELGRAGFKFDQIIGSLKDTLNLSLAGDIDLQEASDIATNILTAMRLPYKTQEQATESLRRVNDAISYAAANSNTDVRKMGETFKYVGPLAAAAGMSVEDVAAASMVMAQSGIKASEAGVAMRSALVRMVRPTKPMIAATERLGINLQSFIKASRQISPDDIIKSLQSTTGIDASKHRDEILKALNDPKLQKSLSGLTSQLVSTIDPTGSVMDKSELTGHIQETLMAAGSKIDLFGFVKAMMEKGATVADVAAIFDQKQGARLFTLQNTSLQETIDRVYNEAAGSTDRMAKTMMQGVVGDWAALVASIENLFLSIAESGVLKSATEAIQSLTSGIKALSESSPTLLKWGTFALMFSVAIAPIALIGGGIISFLLSFVSLIRLIGVTVGGSMAVIRAALGVGAAGAAATGAGTAATAAGAAGMAAKGGSGFWGKAMKGAGAIGAALTAKEVLEWIDPDGNLWGLTTGIDKWAEENLGFNPSKVGGPSERVGPEATPAQAAAHDLAEWSARTAAIDARLKQIEQNVHPAMRDAPNMERDNLQLERADLDLKIATNTAAAGASARATMAAYSSGLDGPMAEAEAKIDAFVAKMVEKLKFSAQPTISPKLDMSSISGVYADVGIR